jgi:hypothetical protein
MSEAQRRMTGGVRRVGRWWIAAAVLLALPACKQADLGPYRTGDIEGLVIDFQTGAPIAGASITTTPPTQAITTGEDGTFRVNAMEVGSYQIAARGHGYVGNSVSVSVRQGQTSRAVIHLTQTPPAATLLVEVIAWWHVRAGADSTFVEAEYRVRNPGPSAVGRHEVYFRIKTDQNDFLHEEKGEPLAASEWNVRRFKTYIVNRTATGVTVDAIWVGG